MQDVVIGSFLGYKPHHLAPWINSLRRSGFSGNVVVFAYAEGPNEVESARFLRRRGVEVHFRPGLRKSIVVDRFADMADYLEQAGRRHHHVIATDLGDVIFQTDPSEYLKRHLCGGKTIIAGSECVRYQDQSWNRENLLASFPREAPALLPLTVYNAGVIAARADVAVPFFREIHRLSMDSPCGNPDQAALNLLLHGPYRDQSLLARMQDGWAVHCGVSATPEGLKECRGVLLEPCPRFADLVAVVADGSPACVLHQYNRIPILAPRIRRHFGGAETEPWLARALRKFRRLGELLTLRPAARSRGAAAASATPTVH